jgi:hypothetical protein
MLLLLCWRPGTACLAAPPAPEAEKEQKGETQRTERFEDMQDDAWGRPLCINWIQKYE